MPKFRYVSFVLGLLLLGLVAACHTEPAESAKTAAEKGIGGLTMYSKIFADFRQTCSQQLRTQATGRQVWVTPVGDQSTESVTNLILVDADGLVVQSGSTLRRLDLEGKQLWLKPRDNTLNATDIDGAIIFRGVDGYLHRVDSSGKEFLQEYFIPRCYDRGGVQLVYPLGDDHYLMQTLNRPEEVEHGQPPGQNEYDLFVKGPESYKDIKWSAEFEGKALPGLVTADGKRLVLLNQANQIAVFDIATGKQLSQSEVAGAGFERAALDPSDNVIVYCFDAKDHKKLCSYKLDGTLNWEYLFGSRDCQVAPQPPALRNDGSVLVIVDSTLLNINAGARVWEKPAPFAPLQFVTILGDNSALVTAGQELLHLGDDGNELMRWRVPFGETISTPAVVDDAGRIYLGTQKGIYCVN